MHCFSTGNASADLEQVCRKGQHLPATLCSATPAAHGRSPAAGTRCAALPPPTPAHVGTLTSELLLLVFFYLK